MRNSVLSLSLILASLALLAGAQVPVPAPTPPKLSLAQALAQARANSPTFEAAVVAEGVAKAGTTQARAARLPSLNFLGSYAFTQDNAYIANNGVHEYVSQGTVHEMLNFASGATVRRAQALEALAQANAEITDRGLNATVTAGYYTLVAAGHELATAQLALTDAEKYWHISQELERGGEVAHSDVIKAQLQVELRRRGVREAQLAQQKAQLALAVLLYPNFNQNFTLVDDLEQTPPLPALARIEGLAYQHNPILAAAAANLQQARQGVTIARAALLPGLTLDYTYGIDASEFGRRDEFSSLNPLGLPTLGSSATATINVPLFDWGAHRGQLQAAHLLQQRARVQTRYLQRQLAANLRGFYDEAEAARSELTTLALSRQLATESLRLSGLRYKDGEATIIELVDAETANTAARDAYDTGLVRYRVARAQLQTLTGPF